MSTENDDKRVIIRKRIAATREELFDAWTDPEGMKEWMCPGDIVSVEVEMEARVGGSFLILMSGPTESYEHRGEFTIVERPSKLVFSWTGKDTEWRPTLVTVEFFAVSENESELVLTHENFPSKEVRDRHQSGWSRIVTLLEQHIGGRAS